MCFPIQPFKGLATVRASLLQEQSPDFLGMFWYNLCNKQGTASMEVATSEHLTAEAVRSSFLSKPTQPAPTCCQATGFLKNKDADQDP